MAASEKLFLFCSNSPWGGHVHWQTVPHLPWAQAEGMAGIQSHWNVRAATSHIAFAQQGKKVLLRAKRKHKLRGDCFYHAWALGLVGLWETWADARRGKSSS